MLPAEEKELPSPAAAAAPRLTLTADKLSRRVSVPAGLCQRGEKTVLEGVSTRFVAGELCALVGPSGAGKSSLLSELSAGRDPALRLNGAELPHNYTALRCLVPQTDALYPGLTVEQTLYFSAKLRLPRSTPECKVRQVVDRLVADLSLSKCRGSRVGSEAVRGISGGERKRVSIGVELVTRPRILFVDEPTTGLDSKTAEDIVRLLRELASSGMIVVCTIHQPSAEVLAQFDRLIVLQRGRVAYAGDNGQPFAAYLERINLHLPRFENALEFFLREMLNHANDRHFSDLWSLAMTDTEMNQDSIPADLRADMAASSMKEQAIVTHTNSKWHQFKVVMQRNFLDMVRDKDKLLTSLSLKASGSLTIGLLFINQGRHSDSSALYNTIGPLFFIVLNAGFDSVMQTVMIIPIVRPILIREFHSGALCFTSFFAAQVLCNLLLDSISSCFYFPAYFVIGLSLTAWQFFTFLAALVTLTAVTSAAGLLVGSTTSDFKQARQIILPMLQIPLLLSGYLLPKKDLPNFLEWAYWLSPFQYAQSIIVINEFDGRNFTDGVAGSDYLDEQGLGSEDVARNFGLMIAMLVGLLTAAYFGARHKFRAIVKRM